MPDWIDKRIFLHNYNGELTSGDLIIELEGVIRMIKRNCGEDMKYPSTYPNGIQRLKQVIWILEANAHRYYR